MDGKKDTDLALKTYWIADISYCSKLKAVAFNLHLPQHTPLTHLFL